MTLFDAHVLLGCDSWLSENRPELAHSLDAAGVSAAVSDASGGADWRAAVFPFPSSRSPDYVHENEVVLAAASDDPRLLPVAVVNPNSPENLRWIRSRAAADRLAGLMIWPILCNLDLRALAARTELWDFVAENDLPVTIHVATGAEPSYRPAVAANAYGPLEAVEIAAARPDVRFNLSHALRLSRPALERAARLSNVWTDVSGYSSFGRWLEDGRETFPADDPIAAPDDPAGLSARLEEAFGLRGRVMFGSSEPFCRWWGFSARREREAFVSEPIDGASALVAHGAAESFYRNWLARAQDDANRD